jgi:hypothetical protein
MCSIAEYFERKNLTMSLLLLISMSALSCTLFHESRIDFENIFNIIMLGVSFITSVIYLIYRIKKRKDK